MDCLISENKQMLEINWEDPHQSLFHATWLRFNCQCHTCRGDAPGCYKVEITKFPEELYIDCVEIIKKGSQLRISFDDEPVAGHVTVFEIDILRKRCYCDSCLKEKLSERRFSLATAEKSRQLPTLDYNDAMVKEDDFYFSLMKTTLEEGVCRVVNFPLDDETYLKIAGRTGELEMTPFVVYGYFDEVNNSRSVITSGNLTHALPFHMDFKYTECNGQISFFNCVRFDKEVTGGESCFVDLLEIAELMRREYPEDFKALSEIPIIRECVTEKLHLVYERPCFSVDYHGQVVEVAFAGDYPPLLQVSSHDVSRFFKAYRKLNELIESEDLQLWFKYEPGTMVVFDNRRVLHTRKAFQSNGGVRLFKALYVTAETMRSRYMMLARKLGRDVIAPKIGNGSSF